MVVNSLFLIYHYCLLTHYDCEHYLFCLPHNPAWSEVLVPRGGTSSVATVLRADRCRYPPFNDKESFEKASETVQKMVKEAGFKLWQCFSFFHRWWYGVSEWQNMVKMGWNPMGHVAAPWHRVLRQSCPQYNKNRPLLHALARAKASTTIDHEGTMISHQGTNAKWY